MKKQSGITLVALVITIIVMLILVGVTLNATIDGGIFGTAKTAVNDTQMKIDRDVVETAVFSCLNRESDIYSKILIKNNLPTEWLDVTGEDGGPYTIVSPSGNKFLVLSDGETYTLNEYGFYYGAEYICKGFHSSQYNCYVKFVVREDGTFIVNSYQENGIREGSEVNLYDFVNAKVLTIESVEYNKEYTATATLDAKTTFHVDDNGFLYGTFVIDKEKVLYSDKVINLGGLLECAISEDGQNINVAGKIFTIGN